MSNILHIWKEHLEIYSIEKCQWTSKCFLNCKMTSYKNYKENVKLHILCTHCRISTAYFLDEFEKNHLNNCFQAHNFFSFHVPKTFNHNNNNIPGKNTANEDRQKETESRPTNLRHLWRQQDKKKEREGGGWDILNKKPPKKRCIEEVSNNIKSRAGRPLVGGRRARADVLVPDAWHNTWKEEPQIKNKTPFPLRHVLFVAFLFRIIMFPLPRGLQLYRQLLASVLENPAKWRWFLPRLSGTGWRFVTI